MSYISGTQPEVMSYISGTQPEVMSYISGTQPEVMSYISGTQPEVITFTKTRPCNIQKFFGCKNENFHQKLFDFFFLFLLKA